MVLTVNNLTGFGGGGGALNLYEAIQSAGETANLTMCLDAGAMASYVGSGIVWLDLSGSGNNFDKGVGAAAPTFNGTAGSLNESTYFSFDGGDYFTPSDANGAFWDGYSVTLNPVTVYAVVQLPSAADATLIGTHIAHTTNPNAGIGFGFRAAAVDLAVGCGWTSGSNVRSSVSTYPTGSPFTCGWGVDDVGVALNYYSINGVTETSTNTNQYSVGGTVAPSIGRDAATNTAYLPSGSRVYAIASWSRVLPLTSHAVLYAALKQRFPSMG